MVPLGIKRFPRKTVVLSLQMVHDIYEVLVLRMKLLRPGLLAWFRRAAEGGVGVLSNVPKQAVDLVPCFLLCGEQGVNVLPEAFGQVKDAVKVSNRFPNLSRLRADELECSLKPSIDEALSVNKATGGVLKVLAKHRKAH